MEPSKKKKIPLARTIREKIKEKDRLSRKLFTLKTQKKWGEYDETWNIYCKVRNKVRKLSRSARKEYENNIAKDAKLNPKKVYGYINSKMKVRPGIGNICRDPDNPKSEVTEDDKEKANIFAKFFASVQTDEPDGRLPKAKERKIISAMKKINITGELVLDVMKELKPGKAPGIDNFTPLFLKEVSK